MNSYNENLHTSVVNSLNEQEVALQKVKAEYDAATFSMYYAQGARVTAAEKLELTTKKYQFQQKVNDQAIVDSDLSTNVLTSANNVKSFVATSVTNTSVAAANVQIAANAILKLASDTGSIFSIINAADFDTEIYVQSKTAYDLMNETAYLAEKTSQDSMDASTKIAEVSSNTLADKATVADTSVKDILGIVTTELDDITTQLAADTANLSASNTAEKKTEGELEDVNAIYCSTTDAYTLSNSELNLNLTVTTPTNIGDRTHYIVSFNPYTSPFDNLISMDGNTGYPVENYYIMLAKDSKSSTFSISDAEGLITAGDIKRYVKIPPEQFSVNPIVNSENQIVGLTHKNTPLSKTIFTTDLQDTDGDDMMLGTNYVIFVYAELRKDYKKIINTFDDYMTAASAKFNLTNKLNPVSPVTIGVSNNVELNASISDDVTIGNDDTTISDVITDLEKSTITASVGAKTEPQTLTFNVWENPDYTVQYRCMFLPDNSDLITGLLTVEGLASIETETEGLESISDFYNPRIADTRSEINSLQSQESGVDAQIDETEDKLSQEGITTAKKKKLDSQLASLKAQKTSLSSKIKLLQAKLTRLETNKKSALKDLESNKHIKPGFFFNLLTAEQVPAGSYMVPNPKDITIIVGGDSKIGKYFDALVQNLIADIDPEILKSIQNDINKLKADAKKLESEKLGSKKFIQGLVKLKKDIEQLETDIESINFDQLLDFLNKLLNQYVHYAVKLTLAPETTDNFGNRLINGNKYIPVILSITDAPSVEENEQFTNALSNFQQTNTFIYRGTQKTYTYQL